MIRVIRKRIFKISILISFLFFYTIILFTVDFDSTKVDLYSNKVYPHSDKIDLQRSVRNVLDFQKIGRGPQKLFVYSAYCVKSPKREQCHVIVIGGLLSEAMKPLFCQFYTDKGENFHTVIAMLRPLKTDNAGNDLPYIPYYIFCDTDGVKDERPYFVSIVQSPTVNEPLTNFLRIKYNDGKEKYKFAVCVQPTFDYDDPLQFVEWAEYNIMMGVEKFTMYNMSIGPKTSCLIKSYGDLFEVQRWSSPYEEEIDIRTNGQFIASHDCLTRYKGVAEHLLIVDFDELIVPAPLIGDNFTEMMATLHHSLAYKGYSKEQVCGYVFTTRFFFDAYGNDKFLKFWTIEGNKRAENILKKLYLTRKSVYTKYTNGYHPNKYIVVPDKAVEVAAHSIPQGIGRTRSVNVPFEMAYNHHYRKCTVGNTYHIGQVRLCKNGNHSTDSSAQRFGKKIAIRVADRLYNKAKECNLWKLYE